MDSSDRNIIKKILSNAKKLPLESVSYKCLRCKDIGWIKVSDKYGYVTVAKCPNCTNKNRMKVWLKQSGVSPMDYERYNLDSFITDDIESKKMKKVAISFLKDDKAKGIGYFGRSGSGKTHICIAICQKLNKPHFYWQYRHEIQRIKISMYKSIEDYESFLKKPMTVPYLYIDDLFKGAIDKGRISQQDLQIMFDIINQRYINRLPTIVSSEFSLNEIFKFDEAIGSRLYEMLKPYVINVVGQNKRIFKK